MKKLILSFVFLAAAIARAQVVMTPQTVAYGIKPLAGETFEVHCVITGGGATTGKVNWTVINQAGGSNATLAHSTNTDCTNRVTVNTVQGTLTLNGRMAQIYPNVTSPTGQAVTSVTIADAGLWINSLSTTFPIVLQDGNGNAALGLATTNGSGAITGVSITPSTTGWAGSTVPNQTFGDSATGATAVLSGTVSGGSVTAVSLVSQSGTWYLNTSFAEILRDAAGTNVALAIVTTNGSGVITGVSLASSTVGWNTTNCFGSGFGCWRNTEYDTIEPYTVTSPQHFTLDAQSVDDTSVHAQWRIDVAANTTTCIINPFYKTLYAGQKWELQSHCTGTMDPRVDWTLTSQPAGGDGALRVNTATPTVTTNMLNAFFSATVAGRYTITACNHAEPSKCATTIQFVTGNALPYAATPQGAQPVDCTVDPTMSGTVYDVGPGKPYADFTALPQNPGAGSTIRFFNQDTSPGHTSPTTLHNILYITDASATDPAQPIRYVGCPDSAGNPPHLDASNATAAAWVNNFDETSALALVWIGPNSGGGGGNYSSNAQGSGPYNIVFEGIEVVNTRQPYTFSAPGGTDNSHTWGQGSSAIRMNDGYNVALSSNAVLNDSIGISSYDNSNNNGWGAVSQNFEVQGNVLDECGDGGGNSLDHCLYLQSFNLHAASNVVRGLVSGAQGSDLKTRSFGLEAITSNYLGCNAARTIDKGDREDSGNVVSFGGMLGIGYPGLYGPLYNQYIGPLGQGPKYGIGATNVVTQGDTISMDRVAGIIASSRISFSHGNSLCFGSQHDSGDHGGGDGNRVGEDSQAYETIGDGVGFATNLLGAGLGAEYNPEIPSISYQNDILWTAAAAPVVGVSGPGFMFGDMSAAWYDMGTLVLPGSGTPGVSNYFSVASPIIGTDYHTAAGWANGAPQNGFPNSATMTDRVSVTAANLLTSVAKPFDASYVPTSSSVARTAAAALTGLAAAEPPIFEIDPTTGVRTVRSNLSDVGSRSYAAATLSSITVSPNPGSVVGTGTLQFTATCNWSDSTTTTCTSSAAWTNGGSSHFSVGASTGLVTGVSLGSGTVTATYLTVPGSATVNDVTAPTRARLGGTTRRGGTVSR